MSPVRRAVPLPSHGAAGGARTAQASFPTLGNIWGNHCDPRPLQSRGQARGCSHTKHCFSRRTILRRSSCHHLERRTEPIWSQREKKGVTVNPAGIQQSGAEPRKQLCQHFSGEAIPNPGPCAVSTLSTEDCAKGPCLPRPWSMSLLHRSLQCSWVKRTGCLEVILPVF